MPPVFYCFVKNLIWYLKSSPVRTLPIFRPRSQIECDLGSIQQDPLLPSQLNIEFELKFFDVSFIIEGVVVPKLTYSRWKLDLTGFSGCHFDKLICWTSLKGSEGASNFFSLGIKIKQRENCSSVNSTRENWSKINWFEVWLMYWCNP